MKTIFFICLFCNIILVLFTNFLNDYFSALSLTVDISGLLIMLPAIALPLSWALNCATVTALFMYAFLPQHYFTSVLIFCLITWMIASQRQYIKINQKAELIVISVIGTILIQIGQCILFYKYVFFSPIFLFHIGSSLLLSLLFVFLIGFFYLDSMYFLFKMWGISDKMLMGKERIF